MSNIGKLIYGFCDGYFGRDHYGTYRIEAEGYDWIVARPHGDPFETTPQLAAFGPTMDKDALIAKWSSDEERRRWTDDD